jgi:hypothetical protein
MTSPAGRPARHRGARRRQPQRRSPSLPWASWVSWARDHMLVAALVPAVVVVAAVAAVVVLHLGGQKAGTGSSGKPTVQSVVAVTKGDRWITGHPGQLLTAVTTDIGKLSAAERAGKQDTAKAAGTRLAADAKTALNGPMPPAAAKAYRSALNDLQRAGASAASGNFSQAGPLLSAGEANITKVTAAVNRAAPVAAPGVVNPGE